MYKYKFKIFFGEGAYNFGSSYADEKLNKWLEEHPKIIIFDYQYQQTEKGDHSICIRYIEDSDLFYDSLIKSGEILNCQGE